MRDEKETAEVVMNTGGHEQEDGRVVWVDGEETFHTLNIVKIDIYPII